MFFKKISNRISRFRRKYKLKKLRKKRGERTLREFVYLDEVSLYSLFTSRVGPVATEYTHTDSEEATLGAEVNNIGAKYGNKSISQVLKKSSIQSTFKEFYEFEKDLFLLKSDLDKHEENITSNDIQESYNTSFNYHDSEDIQRGDLLEVDVKLDADSIYKFSMIMNILVELTDDKEMFSSLYANDELEEYKEINELITQLLRDLIPVQCKVTNYSLVTLNHKQYIVHNDVIDKLESKDSLEIQNFLIVGVLDKDYFWKDTRFSLFDDGLHTLLCRISQPVITNSWASIKSLNSVKDIVPEVNELIVSSSNSILSKSLRENNSQALNEKSNVFEKKLEYYAELIFKELEFSEANKQDIEINKIINSNKRKCDSYEEEIEAFDNLYREIIESKSQRKDEELTPDRLAEIREEVNDFVFTIDKITDNSNLENWEEDEELNLLECEIIAAYW